MREAYQLNMPLTVSASAGLSSSMYGSGVPGLCEIDATQVPMPVLPLSVCLHLSVSVSVFDSLSLFLSLSRARAL